MTFRRRVLLALALVVLVTVGSVSTIVSLRTRSAFERADAERTAALVAQFRNEFVRRGNDIVHRIDAIDSGETVSRLALDISRGSDTSSYVTEAKPVADSHQLDLLEFVSSDGAIISSAQWPARFGYKEDISPDLPSKGAVLRVVPLPDGASLGLVAAGRINAGEKQFYVVGGQRLDRDFLSSLTLPSGMRALLYQNLQPGFSPSFLLAPAGQASNQPASGQPAVQSVENAEKLAPLIARAQQQNGDVDAVVQWSGDAADSESFHAIPLKGENDAVLGVLLVGSSRRGLVELQRHIGAFALLVGGAGILLAVILSSWIAARVTRPIERLARAAREVAAGNWDTRVEVGSSDEIGELGESFNSMTSQLAEQRDRAVQAERVAAWRELARRLAHELKNPLFPLQITVENLLRARNSAEFNEVFHESTATLLTELGNLKTIISRFSDFSKMPQPQLQQVNVNDIVRQVVKLHEAQVQANEDVLLQARAEAQRQASAATKLSTSVIPSGESAAERSEAERAQSRDPYPSRDAHGHTSNRVARVSDPDSPIDTHGSKTRATQFIAQLDPSLPSIAIDPHLLHRALSNIVLNALDAMPNGGTITLRTSATTDYVRIEVSDTGSGLTNEECARLFTPYYTTKVHGTGLGLAIVQSVISDHQGSISVDSAPGKGTTFRIDLPRRATTNMSQNDMFKSAMIT